MLAAMPIWLMLQLWPEFLRLGLHLEKPGRQIGFSNPLGQSDCGAMRRAVALGDEPNLLRNTISWTISLGLTTRRNPSRVPVFWPAMRSANLAARVRRRALRAARCAPSFS